MLELGISPENAYGAILARNGDQTDVLVVRRLPDGTQTADEVVTVSRDVLPRGSERFIWLSPDAMRYGFDKTALRR